MASELTKPFEEKMKKTLTALDSDYGTIRAGRANPHVCLLYTSNRQPQQAGQQSEKYQTFVV